MFRFQPSNTLGIGLSLVGLIFSQLNALAQADDPSVGKYADKILDRSVTDPLINDRNADGKVDVRDLAIYINGQPAFATFGSPETLAFHSQGSVSFPIYFSKPVTGTVKIDLGGSAAAGAGLDYTISPSQLNVTNAKTAQINVLFQPWRGIGGEKTIRLTLNRNPSMIPLNGQYSTHLLRIRQFQQGEFVGMLNFPAGTGLPSLAVRIGLNNGGSAVCAFPSEGTILGSQIPLSWSPGATEFPNFTGSASLTIPGSTFGRSSDIQASLAISRMSPPFGDELDAYLEGFPIDDQPALYHATFTFHNLIAAGQGRSPGSNPFAVVHQGWLAIQSVDYAAAP